MRPTTVTAFIALFLILIAAGSYAYVGLASIGAPLPAEGYTALALGAGFSIMVGFALMALVFYSSRYGYDEPPRLRDDSHR
ncbi:hypothetical protein [Bradyrhizobium sp. WD16]|uniref:hypothetical protein n=1 Tax=Bradyrhizobium sp. WD16 TaxID=1521768 RepID=UPI0020A548CA|nr:hypothetical protein [Bradyrhizobium sp. WD16]UTD29778.1 hypothetical protein DB459_25595 [Bradyrhizobium sp. WD16]